MRHLPFTACPEATLSPRPARGSASSSAVGGGGAWSVCLLLLSALFWSATAMAQSPVAVAARLSGVITDEQTGQGIPYASVVYKGRKVAVASDAAGRYVAPRHQGLTLTFSAVGYQSKSVRVDKATPPTLDVRLKPDTRTLQEVTVKSKRNRYSRKNNPAVELMRKVIAAKKATDLSARDFYQYNKYQKLTLAVNNITPELLDAPNLKKKKWLVNQVELCPYNQKLILPVSVDETVSQIFYRKSPRSKKTFVKGMNSTGINHLIQTGDMVVGYAKELFKDVNIYDDQIHMFRYPFTSPIGKDAIGFYRYYIEDTLYVGRDKCYQLTFLPNNQQDFGFRGSLYILADSSYQVRRCEMTIPTKSDVNFVRNLQVVQEFTQLPDGKWVLSVDDMFTELVAFEFLHQFAVIRNTRMTDFAFDALPSHLFKGKKAEVKDVNAMMQGDSFWKQYRQVELTKSESSMESFVHGMEQTRGFKYLLWFGKALIENFVETSTDKAHPSKVDIGPVNTIVTTNFVDGLRTRLSAQTTAALDSNLFFKGYVARGWGSRKSYYGADLTWSFNKKEYLPLEYPKRMLVFSSANDVMSPSDKFMQTDKDNVFTSFKWTKVERMMFYNRQSLTFEREDDGGFCTTVALKTEANDAVGSLYFIPLSESPDRSRWTNWSNPVPLADAANGAQAAPVVSSRKIRTTELRAHLRYAPGETYINSKKKRKPVNHNSPVFTLSHTLGLKGVLGSDYSYNFTEASFFKRVWLNSWGKLDVVAKAGVEWDQVPFPLLIMPETNLSYIVQDNNFQLIDNMEFLNDRYASLVLNWDLNGKLFNRVPLLRKLKWREWLSVKCLWGDLSDKNNPLLAENAGSPLLMYFPETSYVMDSHRPYWELAVGVHNILKFFHVEYVRRLNYLDLPTAHRDGIRAKMTFSF